MLSTVNVQHLESLNDQVAELTGVRVRETVPDEVLSRADEVVLVDLPPADLIERLREGKVYPASRVPTALKGFFRVENLRALREVALRQVAETVEVGNRAEETPIAERLLAFVGLERRAHHPARVAHAQRLGGELDVLLVRSGESSAQERARLEALRRLTSVLGAHLIVEDASDPIPVLERVARERGTTYVLLAEPEPRRFREPLVMRILRALPHADVRIVRERA